MPTFTPTAFAAELAKARAAGIEEAAALTAALVAAGASPAVQAGALDGLANESRAEVVARVEATNAEAKAKSSKPKAKGARAAAPAPAADPLPERAAASELA